MSNTEHTGGVKTIDRCGVCGDSHGTATIKCVVQQMLIDYTAWANGEPMPWNVKKAEGLAKLEALMQERLDQQHNELTGNETKVWITREEFDKRTQDKAIEARMSGKEDGIKFVRGFILPLFKKRGERDRVERLFADASLSVREDLKQLRTANQTLKGEE